MNIPEWNYLLSFLHYNKEEEIGIEILQNILSLNVQSLLQEDCEGCKKDWASQKDHACLMQEKTKKDITKAINEVKVVLAFIVSHSLDMVCRPSLHRESTVTASV